MDDAKPTALEVLEDTLHSVARGNGKATATERMRAALALVEIDHSDGIPLGALRAIIHPPRG